MKKIIIFLFLLNSALLAQSPFYSIKFNVKEPVYAEGMSSFTVSWQSCSFDYDPVIPSGDYWFGNDFSAFDWNRLPDSMYNKTVCSEIDTGFGLSFKSSDQAMMWEKILKFTIKRTLKINNTVDSMTIVFPVLIKGFVTNINLGNFNYKPGYFELTDDILYKIDSSKHVHLSLPNGFKWYEINYSERKIKL